MSSKTEHVLCSSSSCVCQTVLFIFSYDTIDIVVKNAGRAWLLPCSIGIARYFFTPGVGVPASPNVVAVAERPPGIVFQ